MLAFITRRLVTSVLIFFSATFVVYIMAANLGDPLADLRELPPQDREAAIADRTERMNLDKPVVARYFLWLGGVLTGDLGTNRVGQDVNLMLERALGATLQLVLAATVLSIVIGVGIGVISALRQYSALDLGVTFGVFVCFSLPVFWVATLLKQYGAIEFNDWLADPSLAWWVIGLIALFMGAVFSSLLVTDRRTRLMAFGVAAAVTAVLLAVLSATAWFADPGLGPIVIGLTAGAAAVGFATLFSGLEWNPTMKAAAICAALGLVSHFALLPFLDDPTWWFMGLLALLTVAICWAVGYFVGGELYRRSAVPVSILTGLFTAAVIFVDRMLQSFASFSESVRGRPISTIGASTPNYSGSFWDHGLDSFGSLILPTMALLLISLASYTRYSRASMLEVMNQDYVRTARAKGLPERTVILRHAFRNGLIPITTLVAFDIGTVLGGAVIIETVFGWRAMGDLLITGINERDPNPVMAFFLVAGTAIVVFNMIADIVYAYLDPRIRLS
ncbi:ABC transporter permease subunit [Streptomyces alkaliphilus]|uniref:ABC transporter permease subunit n=1 Tax=Streptomyces alkaliphilus TaxID=1472722 RepID=A0A7W3TAY6_9ACTN|nr:ABC transporter permease [Streptomyces alkaliphilus]MBB0243305.1 ABC transporter permease subunit [Streptomyces alkaliphilus]